MWACFFTMTSRIHISLTTKLFNQGFMMISNAIPCLFLDLSVLSYLLWLLIKFTCTVGATGRAANAHSFQVPLKSSLFSNIPSIFFRQIRSQTVPGSISFLCHKCANVLTVTIEITQWVINLIIFSRWIITLYLKNQSWRNGLQILDK